MIKWRSRVGSRCEEGDWKEWCLWGLAVARTCDGHAVVLFILGEEPGEDPTGAGGEGDGGIGVITEQMWSSRWCWRW